MREHCERVRCSARSHRRTSRRTRSAARIHALVAAALIAFASGDGRRGDRRPASSHPSSYFHGLGPCRPTSGVWGSVKTATASMGHKSPAGTVERVVESGRVSRKRNAVRFISTIPPRRTNTVHAGEDARYSAHSCTPCVLCAHSDMSCGWTARPCLHMLARSGVW